MNAVEIIRRKRDGEPLTRDEVSFLLNDYLSGKIPDYQMSAFLMACYFRGMTEEESGNLTDLMLHSGTILDLSDIPGIKADKHSTGGVSDSVSLILAPLAAACGCRVPMISGRGLGHTGGTLDKLEAIPGFRTALAISEFRRVLSTVGVSMIGQTEDIAPADRKLYALRDVTATIESIPLIAGSIMSKKLASGIDVLVLDIKTGDGAFMKNIDRAIELGKTLVRIGTAAGKKTVAYVTDMSHPLGSHIGNVLEVDEALRSLRGEEDRFNADLLTVTHLMTGTMLWLSGLTPDVPEGVVRSRAAAANGSGLAVFRRLVEAQGGDTGWVDKPGNHTRADHSLDVVSTSDGFLESIETESLGMSAVLLGAGRKTIHDTPDPLAGIILKKRRGMSVRKGEPLAVAFSNNQSALDSAAQRLAGLFHLSPGPPPPSLLVKAAITRDGVAEWKSMESPQYPG